MDSNLDFEGPILELEQKVAELRGFGREQDIDVNHGIELLEARIEETRKSIFTNLTPWQRVQLARHPERPHPQDYIERLFSDFLELHGDRRFSDDRAVIGGFGRLDGEAVMVIGTRKGRELRENVEVNFGCAHPEGYRKALRLMQLADKARVPIVSLIDTPGAYPGIGAEERHVGESIAVNLREHCPAGQFVPDPVEFFRIAGPGNDGPRVFTVVRREYAPQGQVELGFGGAGRRGLRCR